MAARAGWPHRAPGGLGVWLDRMKAYVDARTGPMPPMPPRGVPVALVILPPAAAVGVITLTRNPDGSATFDGHMNIAGPVTAGDPVVWGHMPDGFELADSAGLIARGNLTTDVTQLVVGIDINPGSGADLFAMTPEIPEGVTLMVILDGVTCWPIVNA